MYINKIVIFTCVLGFVKAHSSLDDLQVIDSIRYETPCLSQGGICVIAEDCPPGLLAEQRGLCPAQRRRGVECCHGISVKETRCVKRGGDCREDCKKSRTDNRATDCPEHTFCCILTN